MSRAGSRKVQRYSLEFKRKAVALSQLPDVEVQAVRAKLGASQARCALMIGVSVATIRNWEQGRRTPERPAVALLRVAARNPKAVIQALHGEPKRGAV